MAGWSVLSLIHDGWARWMRIMLLRTEGGLGMLVNASEPASHMHALQMFDPARDQKANRHSPQMRTSTRLLRRARKQR
jgi:hypothetical protein